MSFVDLPISHVKLTYKLNDLDKFSCEIPNRDEFRSRIRYGAQVELLYFGSRKFLGIIGKTTYYDEKIKITGHERAVRLDWLLFKPNNEFRVDYDSVAANTILADILEATGYTISECPSTQVTIRFEHTTKLDALMDLADILDKDWWMSGSDFTAVHIGTRGTNRGLIEEITVSSKTDDPEKIENIVHAGGYGDGVNQPFVSRSEPTSQTEYGTRERSMTDRRRTEDTALTAVADKRLTDRSQPLEAIDLHIDTHLAYDYNLEPGDTIILHDPAKRLDSSYRLRSFSLGDMERTKLELDTTISRLSDDLQNLGKTFSEQSKFAQGTTNYNVLVYVGTMDSAKKFRFYLSTEYKIRKRIRVTWYTEESFSTVTLNVNGSTIDSWGSDQSEVDVSNYCSDGWNYLYLQYNGDPTNNVTIHVSVHTFVESK